MLNARHAQVRPAPQSLVRGTFVPGLASLIRLLFPYNGTVPNVRSCLVSFVDGEGIEHSISAPAESIYEAAVEAMAAFRRGAFAEMTFGAGTQLRIRVRAPEE